MPAPDGPVESDTYETKMKPSQVTRDGALVYVKGSWSGVRLGEPAKPSPDIPGIRSFNFSFRILIIRLGGFIIAPHDERGTLRFESPFESRFMWRGCNSEVVRRNDVNWAAKQVNISLFI